MNITDSRIISEPDFCDLNKFLKFLRGGDYGNHEGINLPASLSDTVNKKIQALSPIKSLAKVTYTSNDRLDVVVDTDGSNDSGWITNELLKSQETPTISKISIHLHQLFSKPKVAHSLIEDLSANVEEFIQDKITTQMASSENKSFLFGDGLTQPKGILRYEISIGKTEPRKIEGIVGGKPGELRDYKKIVEIMESLPSRYLSGATWIMSRNAASYIRNMKDEQTERFLWQNSIAQSIPDTILGYPVVICDDMPKISNNKGEGNMIVPILFANLYEGYQIAEKPNINILKDPYNSKPFIEFYATKRIGGDVVNFDAIKALVLKN